MCVLKTKMCWVFHTVGSCKWCFAHETSSAWPITLPCHVACQVFYHASFAHSIWSICWRFRDEPPWILNSRRYITRQRIWKAQQWRKTCSPAANTAGNFLHCPPTAHLLPSNQHWVSGWGVTAGLVGTHPWPLHERLTKRQEPFLCILRKVHKLEDRQRKLPLLNMWKHFRFSHHSAGCIVKKRSYQGFSSVWSFCKTFFLHNRAGMTARITTESFCPKKSHKEISECILSLSDKCFSEWIWFWKPKKRLAVIISPVSN